jgi:hypothetical protein
LEEYLNDKDFEVNRRQYMAEKEAKKNGGKPVNGASKPADSKPATSNMPSSQTTNSQQPAADQSSSSANAPLIDLFESLENNQQDMATQPMMQQYPQQYPQQTDFPQQQAGFQMPQQTANMGFPQQGTNPFQMQQQPQAPQMQPQPPQIQPQFTGAGFGGYTQQPFNPQNTMPSIPQNGMADYSQQQNLCSRNRRQRTRSVSPCYLTRLAWLSLTYSINLPVPIRSTVHLRIPSQSTIPVSSSSRHRLSTHHHTQ